MISFNVKSRIVKLKNSRVEWWLPGAGGGEKNEHILVKA